MPNGEHGKSPRVWYRLQIGSRRLFNRLPLREHRKIHLLTLLIGAVCGLAAVCLHRLLDLFQQEIIYPAAATPG